MSSMTLFFIFVCVIAVLFLTINFWIAPHNPYDVKLSAFECGFRSFLQTRSPFNISFFIYAIVFLLFDLEILLLYPFPVSANNNGIYGLCVMLAFSLIITVGFVFELGKGALNISNRQQDNISSRNISTYNINYIGSYTPWMKNIPPLNSSLILDKTPIYPRSKAFSVYKFIVLISKEILWVKGTVKKDYNKYAFELEKILNLTDSFFLIKKYWVEKYFLLILYTLMILFVTSLFIHLCIFKDDLSFSYNNISTMGSGLCMAILMYKNRDLSLKLSISSIYLIINILIISLIIALFIYIVTSLIDNILINLFGIKSFELSFMRSFNLSRKFLGVLLLLKLTISIILRLYKNRNDLEEFVNYLAIVILSLVVLSFFYNVIHIIFLTINYNFLENKISNVESKLKIEDSSKLKIEEDSKLKIEEDSKLKIEDSSKLKIEDKSLNHHFNKSYPKAVSAKGIFINTEDGRKVLDAASGAAVASIGYGNEQVIEAIYKKYYSGIHYVASSAWKDLDVLKLQEKIAESIDGKMGEVKVYLTGSGSDAIEAAIKICRQYYYDQDEGTNRTIVITRDHSYHGNTLGALSISDFYARQAPYKGILSDNVEHVSSCYTYRQQLEGVTDAEFIDIKAAELEEKILEIGPDKVLFFILEPVSGAALGCAYPPDGYLEAMKGVCSKYGVILVYDEIMCGTGRTGDMHFWQGEKAAPDLLIQGKGLGAGYFPLAAVVVSESIWKGLKTEQFIHGLTFDALPIAAVAANEVQAIIKDKNLLDNVKKQGAYLKESLRTNLKDHPNVGDIRGKGLFLGVEFVKDKVTKEPFEPELCVAQKIVELAKSPKYNVVFYPGNGTVDGIRGDHIIIAPPFIVTEKDVDLIVKVLSAVIEEVFKEINQ